MPRDREKYNAYHKEYQLNRYHERMVAAIESLGGKCVKCGSTQDLQLDHINPETKKFVISQVWSANEEKFRAELSKCQPLCVTCHKAKTKIESSKPDNHGSYWQYKKYGCRCQACCDGFKKQNKIYKERSKLNKMAL